MKIFLSYENRTHEHLASEIAMELKRHDYDVWFDKSHRQTLLRRLAGSPQSDYGLDGWLRKGMYESTMILVIVPYSNRNAIGSLDTMTIPGRGSAEWIWNIVKEQLRILGDSYNGKAPATWWDPTKLDKFFYYMAHPIHTFRMVWYEVKTGVPLGKDPFEQWRRWEMRVAGYLRLSRIAIIPIEAEDEDKAGSVSIICSKIKDISVIRRGKLEEDVKEILIPAMLSQLPTAEETAFIRRQSRRIRTMENLLRLRIGLISTSIVAVILFSTVKLHRWHVNIFLIILIELVLFILIIVGIVGFVPMIRKKKVSSDH